MDKKINAVYEDIKSRIINLNLVPGTKIKEATLAEEYNLSRTPIRSVIERLVGETLLEVKPKKGTYVSKIDFSKVQDYIYVRKVVEGGVIYNLANNITDEQIKELEDIIEEQGKIIKTDPSFVKSKRFFHNDNSFHKKIFSFSGLEGVWTLIHTNATPLNRVRIISNLRETAKVSYVFEKHVEIVKYLKEKDGEKAAKAFDEHMDCGFEGIDEIIAKYKSYFK